jgi:hypothetical protein
MHERRGTSGLARAGRRVVGLAPTNTVAQDLRAAGFTNAGTVHAELFRLKKGRTSWDRRTALIIDEAAMLDAPAASRAARWCGQPMSSLAFGTAMPARSTMGRAAPWTTPISLTPVAGVRRRAMWRSPDSAQEFVSPGRAQRGAACAADGARGDQREAIWRPARRRLKSPRPDAYSVALFPSRAALTRRAD